MKRGDFCFFKKGRKRYWVEVVSDHTPTFPAVTVLRGEEEWIVGINDLVTAEEIKVEEQAKRVLAEQSVADIVEAFKAGNDTFGSIARFIGFSQVQILSRARKAERLGLIKLKRRYEPKKEPSPGQPGTQLPDLPA